MLTCLEWIFTMLQWGFCGIVALGAILVVVGMTLALGSGAFAEASAIDAAGMTCSFGFFVGLAMIIILLKARR